MKKGFVKYKYTHYGMCSCCDPDEELEIEVPAWFPEFIDNFKMWKKSLKYQYSGINPKDNGEVCDCLINIPIWNSAFVKDPNCDDYDEIECYSDHISLDICEEYDDQDEISDILFFLQKYDSETEDLTPIQVTKENILDEILKLLEPYKK